MSKLLLVRHGQASFGKKNYDQLSALGEKQSFWLGEYLASIDKIPELIVRGSMERHRQTAENISLGLQRDLPVKVLPEWNEFDFATIARAYLDMHPDELPEKQDVRSYFAVLRKAMMAWSQGELSTPIPESWQSFQARIRFALDESCRHSDLSRVIVVSSGGAIAATMQTLLSLSNESLIDLNLQTRNTGVSEIFFNPEKRYLSSFNSLPHLSHASRQDAITST